MPLIFKQIKNFCYLILLFFTVQVFSETNDFLAPDSIFGGNKSLLANIEEIAPIEIFSPEENKTGMMSIIEKAPLIIKKYLEYYGLDNEQIRSSMDLISELKNVYSEMGILAGINLTEADITQINNSIEFFKTKISKNQTDFEIIRNKIIDREKVPGYIENNEYQDLVYELDKLKLEMDKNRATLKAYEKIIRKYYNNEPIFNYHNFAHSLIVTLADLEIGHSSKSITGTKECVKNAVVCFLGALFHDFHIRDKFLKDKNNPEFLASLASPANVNETIAQISDFLELDNPVPVGEAKYNEIMSGERKKVFKNLFLKILGTKEDQVTELIPMLKEIKTVIYRTDYVPAYLVADINNEIEAIKKKILLNQELSKENFDFLDFNPLTKFKAENYENEIPSTIKENLRRHLISLLLNIKKGAFIDGIRFNIETKYLKSLLDVDPARRNDVSPIAVQTEKGADQGGIYWHGSKKTVEEAVEGLLAEIGPAISIGNSYYFIINSLNVFMEQIPKGGKITLLERVDEFSRQALTDLRNQNNYDKADTIETQWLSIKRDFIKKHEIHLPERLLFLIFKSGLDITKMSEKLNKLLSYFNTFSNDSYLIAAKFNALSGDLKEFAEGIKSDSDYLHLDTLIGSLIENMNFYISLNGNNRLLKHATENRIKLQIAEINKFFPVDLSGFGSFQTMDELSVSA